MAATLQSPADGATNVSYNPTYEWTGTSGYIDIEISKDNTFATVDFDIFTNGQSTKHLSPYINGIGTLEFGATYY
jgi:hypothetical protein